MLSRGAYELPYSEDFSDGDACKQLFTFVDVDNDGHDNQATWFWKEDEKLMQYCSDNVNKGNDWLFTPAIHLDGKHMYKLKFDINMGATSNLKVTIGKTANPDEQTEIIDLNGVYESWQTTHEATFTVPEDGNYYIGFYDASFALISGCCRYARAWVLQSSGNPLAPNTNDGTNILTFTLTGASGFAVRNAKYMRLSSTSITADSAVYVE